MALETFESKQSIGDGPLVTHFSFQTPLHRFMEHSFNLETLRTFIHNVNYMVLMHIAIGVLAVYLSITFDIMYNMQVLHVLVVLHFGSLWYLHCCSLLSLVVSC